MENKTTPTNWISRGGGMGWVRLRDYLVAAVGVNHGLGAGNIVNGASDSSMTEPTPTS